MSVRVERVASTLKEELSTYLQREFPMEEYGLMTVTEVRMSPDLRHAKVFVSVFGDDERKKKALTLLETQTGKIRSAVGRAVRLRFTPTLAFALDETVDRAMNLERILRQIHEEEEQRHRRTEGDA